LSVQTVTSGWAGEQIRFWMDYYGRLWVGHLNPTEPVSNRILHIFILFNY